MPLHQWLKHLKPLLLSCKDKPSLLKLHALMILTGVLSHGNFNGELVASYVRVGHFELAHQVFEKTPQRGVGVWNALIIAYSSKGYQDEVLRLYRQMIVEGVKPDSSTFTVAIKACTRMLDLKCGKEIWYKAVDCGYEFDVFVCSSVLSLFAKFGKMDEAMEVFDKMPRRDIVCWTNLITGYVQSGKSIEAVAVYRRMQKEGTEGDDGVVMLSLIQACANLGDSRLGLSVHGYLIRRDIPMDVAVQTSLIDMYSKNGHLELAFKVFKMISRRNAISWGVLINGLAQNGFAGIALDLFLTMQCEGLEPDLVSVIGAILACSQAGFLKLGKSIHGYIVRRFELDHISGTVVIDMYSKCGALSLARAVFNEMIFRDRISWNAMISAYGIHGHGKEALSHFLHMIETNVKPDHDTFASLFSALSHSGLVEEGRYWFNLMVSEYKIPPDEKHYACIVDLLARAGHVEEAYKLLDSSSVQPGLPILVALLAGCYSHAKLFIGENVVRKILELNPDDLGIYALVSNFYAMAGKLNEVAWVKKIMKTKRMKKVPGYSAIQIKGKQHAFVSADNSRKCYEDIICMLNQLDREMREKVYVQYMEYLNLMFNPEVEIV